MEFILQFIIINNRIINSRIYKIITIIKKMGKTKFVDGKFGKAVEISGEEDTDVVKTNETDTLKIENERVVDFQEKPHIEGKWVNGGFFVLNPEVFDYIKNDSTVWEKEPMEKLTKDGQLSAYKHRGFYQPMDTISDKNHLEKLWQNNEALWKVW